MIRGFVILAAFGAVHDWHKGSQATNLLAAAVVGRRDLPSQIHSLKQKAKTYKPVSVEPGPAHTPALDTERDSHATPEPAAQAPINSVARGARDREPVGELAKEERRRHWPRVRNGEPIARSDDLEPDRARPIGFEP